MYIYIFQDVRTNKSASRYFVATAYPERVKILSHCCCVCAPYFLAVERRRRTAVIADLLLLGTAHIGVQLHVARTANLLQLLPKINRSRWSWRWSVATLVRTWILDPAPCTRPGRWRRGLRRSGWILFLLPGSRAEAELLPAGVQQGGGRQAHGTLRVLPQNLLVCFTLVDFQAIRSFEP